MSGLCLVLATTSVLAQQPAFKAAVELVTVPVTVTTRDGSAHIDDLTGQDFRVFEDRVRQEVTLVSRLRRPVSLCIVLDSSGSMAVEARRSLAIASVRQILRGLDADDEVSIVLFTAQPELVVPWTRAGSVPPINWDSWKPEGYSALLDGLKTGLSVVGGATRPSRAVLMVTDGFENSSRASARSVITNRQQSEVAVYAFALGVERPGDHRQPSVLAGEPRPPRSVFSIDATEDVLTTLVGESGGILARIQNASHVGDAAKRMLDDLRYQYTLGYTPAKPADGKYRRLKVETTRKGVAVRHRAGYLALP